MHHFVKLYNQLDELDKKTETFYSVTTKFNSNLYKIFSYRLASYTDFLNDGALESRGIMFKIDEDHNPIDLVSRPMEKFFNAFENPMVMDLNFNDVMFIEDKADGSLISSFTDDKLYLKSKTSLISPQAIDSTSWLNTQNNLYNEIYDLDNQGFTVNMEWCSPFNRIVLNYEKPHLQILNVRNRYTGEYLLKEDLSCYPNILNNYIKRIECDDINSFIKEIPNMKNIEGFVLTFKSNFKVKMKTLAYLSAHKAKDNVNSPRKLYECVLNESTDDLRSLFKDNNAVLDKITEMELFVDKTYNHLVDSVEKYYEENKHLERKEYAIKGQKELPDSNFFGLAMMKYLGKEVNYKDFMVKRWKEFGIKDITNNEGVEYE